MKLIKSYFYLFLLFPLIISTSVFAQPKRAILFIIDGISWKTPQKIRLPNLEKLINEGTYIEKSYTVVPYHPTIGPYARRFTCSFPNPVLQSGTLFITDSVKMIQQVFRENGLLTAHVVNSSAYAAINDHYNFSYMRPGEQDESPVEFALELLRNEDIRYMRLHLQQLNSKGFALSFEYDPANLQKKWTDRSAPYFRNIWGKGSPYIKQLVTADSLLGVFVNELKKMGKWRNTLLFVTGDNGHSDSGWHPYLDEDAWACPMVIVGPGVAEGRKLAYSEHTDIVPTICKMLNMPKPNPGPGCGRMLTEILEANNGSQSTVSRYLLQFNRQIKRYEMLKSKMILASQEDSFLAEILTGLKNEYLFSEPFYGIERYLEWSKAGSVKHLIEANREVLDKMLTFFKRSPVYNKYK